MSRPFGGAWIETSISINDVAPLAWIETHREPWDGRAPSGARGLKRTASIILWHSEVAPSGARGLKHFNLRTARNCRAPSGARGLKQGSCVWGFSERKSRPFGGAWIETAIPQFGGAWIETGDLVTSRAPSGARGLKLTRSPSWVTDPNVSRAPSGARGLKLDIVGIRKSIHQCHCRAPSGARGLKHRESAVEVKDSRKGRAPSGARGLKLIVAQLFRV